MKHATACKRDPHDPLLCRWQERIAMATGLEAAASVCAGIDMGIALVLDHPEYAAVYRQAAATLHSDNLNASALVKRIVHEIPIEIAQEPPA